ncbi:MAG: phage integrase [Thermoleophilia bacterium]|nr:phage integrase [Thermoleophilia bacterium]
MALFKKTRDGRTFYRVRWNYRTVDGREVFDEKDFSSKSAAKAFDKRVEASTSTSTERITVAELAEHWVAGHVAAVDHEGNRRLSQRTEKDYREQLRLRILPLLGHMRCSRLTPAILSNWQLEALAMERTIRVRARDGRGRLIRVEQTVPTSAAVVNKSQNVLKAMIRWGRSQGLTDNRAIDDVRRLPQAKAKGANPYPPDDIDRIAAGCELLRDATLIYVAAYSGLRWSELCALEWRDVDLESKTIELERSLDLDRSTKEPKSGDTRIVPILDPGIEALRRWRDQAPDTELIFPDQRGGPLRSNWYRHDRTMKEVTSEDRNLGRIRKACGIHFEPHQLRDTYASILIQSGIGEAELTLWLGHKSISTTLENYGKLFERRKTALAVKANQLIGSLRAPS